MKETVIAKTLEGKNTTVAVNDLRFRVCTYAVIIKGDEVLLTPWDDGWDFPGGGIEIDETIEEALLREVREEVGMTIDQGPLITVGGNFFVGVNSTKPMNSVCIYYVGLNPRQHNEGT